MILKNIAQKISDDTSKVIGYPVTICDENGYLIGVNDPDRLGLFDNLFAEVIKKRKLMYWNEDAFRLENIYPGVAAPIIVNDEVLGAVGVLGKTGHTAETTSYIKLVKNHIEMLCHEAIKKEIKSLKSSAIDTLIHYILNSSNNKENTAQIIRYGEMLGFNLEINRICFIIKINQFSEARYRNLNQLTPDNSNYFIVENIFDIFKSNHQDLVGRINIDEYIVFKAINTDYLEEKKIEQLEKEIERLNKYLKKQHNLTATAFIGNVQSSVDGLKQSYSNALKVLNNVKNFEVTKPMYDFNDLSVRLNVLLGDLPENIIYDLKKSFSHFTKQENYDILAATFIAYCDNKYNLSDTSRNLFIHRNTLIYRLKKISELTNIDTNKFEHCILLYIIIKKNGFNLE